MSSCQLSSSAPILFISRSFSVPAARVSGSTPAVFAIAMPTRFGTIPLSKSSIGRSGKLRTRARTALSPPESRIRIAIRHFLPARSAELHSRASCIAAIPDTPSSLNNASPVSVLAVFASISSVIRHSIRCPFSPRTCSGGVFSAAIAGKRGADECPSCSNNLYPSPHAPSLLPANPPAAIRTFFAKNVRSPACTS